jgi:predicted LPLAT superfamily acyltransferase
MLSGRFRFRFRFDRREEFKRLVADPRGMILLTSHVGNWQIAMASLDKLDKPIHLLMRPEDNDAVRRAFQLDKMAGAIRIISIDEPFGGVVDVMNALRAGHVVSLMGDRPYDFDAVTVEFLGQPARFPYSAFKIAAMADVPVAVMFSAKTSRNDYAIEVPAVYYPKKGKPGSKQELWAPYVRQYVETLETFLHKYPLQFFAFQDLWTSDTPQKGATDVPES